MKRKLLIYLVLVWGLGFAGCSTSHRSSDTTGHPSLPSDEGASKLNAKLPLTFVGYHELYTFIAQREGLPNDTNTLFKLAADSRMDIITLEDKELPYVYLVESHYYNGGIYDQIRGAQGNGDYFILRPLATNNAGLDTDKGFELVGIAEGNSCKLTYSNDIPQFVAHWHMSAAENVESIYEWNGKIFEQIK